MLAHHANMFLSWFRPSVGFSLWHEGSVQPPSPGCGGSPRPLGGSWSSAARLPARGGTREGGNQSGAGSLPPVMESNAWSPSPLSAPDSHRWVRKDEARREDVGRTIISAAPKTEWRGLFWADHIDFILSGEPTEKPQNPQTARGWDCPVCHGRLLAKRCPGTVSESGAIDHDDLAIRIRSPRFQHKNPWTQLQSLWGADRLRMANQRRPSRGRLDLFQLATLPLDCQWPRVQSFRGSYDFRSRHGGMARYASLRCGRLR